MTCGFSTEYGMNGNSLGYSEEAHLQRLMSHKGYLIGFDPGLQVDHAVDPKKYSIFWHLKDAYVMGIYIAKLNNEKRLLRLFFDMLILFFRNIFISTKKIINSKDYYWQNFLYDTLRPTLYRLGKVSFILYPRRKGF